MRNSYFVEFFVSLAVTVAAIFIPILAEQLGLNFIMLGLVTAAFSLGAFISYYVFGALSDLTGDRRHIVIFGLLACVFVFPLQIFIADFLSMLVLRFLAGFAMGIYTFPLVALVAEYSKKKRALAFLSAIGSLGAFVGSIAAGLVLDFATIFLLSGFFCLIGLFFALHLPKAKSLKLNISLLPVRLIRNNEAVYSTFFLRHLGANMVWVILPLYMISLGASLLWVGILYAVNAIAQVAFSEFAGKLSDKTSEVKLIKYGLVFSIAGFLSYAVATHFLHLLVSELLIAVAWAFLYIGCLINLTEKNPEKATATALLGDTIRLAMMLGPLLGGIIAFFFGFRATIIAAFLLSTAALAVSRRI